MAEYNQCESNMPSHNMGPCGLTADQLINNGAQLNGAFSEFAWANARQNSGCMPCPGKELPAWPPATNDWGHTYPVQSKKGEEIQGSQMNVCGEAPFYINPQLDFDQRQSNPPEIFKRFTATNIPREHSQGTNEYDLALDAAEKILQGNSLSMSAGNVTNAPASKSYGYFQAPEYAYPDQMQDLADGYQSGQRNGYPPRYGSNKRLENLLEPVEQLYGAGKELHDDVSNNVSNNVSNDVSDVSDDSSHSWQNVIPCTQNTIQGVAYDVKHWQSITPQQCDGNKFYYVFGRDDRWKYLTFVGLCITIFILFIIAIATSITSLNNADSIATHSNAVTLNSSGTRQPQKFELIIQQAK